jgi:Zn-dependent protease
MSETILAKAICVGCGIELAPTMLACPKCSRLVHKESLERLAREATDASVAGDLTESLQKWREALELIPRNTKQYAIIADKISELGLKLPNAEVLPKSPKKGTMGKTAGVATGVGAIGLLFWKFKFLLAGLTKSSTLFSMLASLGVYWTIWGWKFALGILLSIYVHEMGHMIQLKRYGFRTGAPMFIPGLGALIRMQQNVVNARESADIGLAGPIYGLGAALVSLGLWFATSMPIFAAIAGVGAWINLFNLLPIGSLDGGRAMQSMSRVEKIACAVCVGIAWYLTHESMLVLILIVCIGQLFAQKHEAKGYRKAAVIYCLLVFALTGMSLARNLAEESKAETPVESNEPVQQSPELPKGPPLADSQ